MSIKRFNLRVYGLILNDLGEVLVSDEHEFGMGFTKFPGGGLEFGESLPDGLRREIKEELELDVEIGELYYFNDFAQISQFNNDHQLFSFYYIVRIDQHNEKFREPYAVPLIEQGEKQRWVKIQNLKQEMFTFPIDRLVVGQLLEQFC